VKVFVRQTGFTLIEMLMALAVLSIVLAIGYGSLSQLLAQQIKLNSNHQQMRDLQVMTQLMEYDFAFASRRRIRNEYASRLAAFSGEPNQLRLTSSGRRMSKGIRQSRLQHIEYEFKNNSLRRLVWQALDGFRKEDQTVSISLVDIKGLKWQFLSPTGVWENTWPATGQGGNSSLPRAVQLNMELSKVGPMQQIFLLPR